MSTDDPSVPYEEVFYDYLRDPSYLCDYLKVSFEEALEEKDFGGFLVSVHHAVEANKLQKKQVAEDSGLSRQHLYRVLNGESVPSFDKVVGLLATLGIKLDFSLKEN